MPTNAYGAYNPQATDPYPIETTLAQQVAKTSPALAYPMLLDYRIQRETAGNQAADQLAGQHDFAAQQLAATIANNKAKNMAELLGKPGGAAVMASTPDYQYGVPAETLQQLAADDARARQAKTFQEANSGLYSGIQAGYTYPTDAVSYMTGLQANAGTPLSLRVEAAKAADAAKRAVADKYNVNTVITGSDNQQYNVSGKLHPGEDTVKAFNEIKQKNFGVVPGLPPAQRDTGGGGGTAPPPAAATAPPARGGGNVTPTQNTTKGVNEVQQGLEAGLSSGTMAKYLSPGQIAAVKRGMAANSNHIAIGAAPNGRLVILDEKRQPIPGTEFSR